MDKENLRNMLITRLWQVNKLDIMYYIREFAEGETAAMSILYEENAVMTPSRISERLKISRARMTSILKTLREKGYVSMDIAGDDRRKMLVSLTKEGYSLMAKKMEFLNGYFDLYVEEMGEEAITQLTEIINVTIQSQDKVIEKLKTYTLPD